jgi:2-C-methyl-D-erythritol 4-phosphate cytidylyltransferase
LNFNRKTFEEFPMTVLKKFALIVAGGSGNRMNSKIPKQFLLLNQKPVLMHTLERFVAFDPSIDIILVLPSGQFDYWKELCIQYDFKIEHLLVAGGEVRFESVKNGLSEIHEDGIVAIHDGVRPLVSLGTIDRCFKMTEEKGNALPVMPVVESVRMVEGEKSFPVDREKYVAVQTPQVFRISEIKKAYSLGFDSAFTDDTMVLERLGIKINLVEGNRENIKITHASDMIVAEALLGNL